MTSTPIVLAILSGIESDLRHTIEQVEKDGDLYTNEDLLTFWRKFDALKTVVEGGGRAMDRARKRNWLAHG